MILVTLGTQKQSFTRLLDYIENSNIKEEIYVQAGHTKYKSNKMKIFSFIDYNEMNEYIKNADLIITHGGTGSIITPLKLGKKVIACARKQEHGEHVDNHQEELVNIFAEEGYILKIEEDNLDEIYNKSQKFKPKKYASNSEKFKNNLKKEIEKNHNKESLLIFFLFISFIILGLALLILRPQKEISDTENRTLNKIDLSLINKFNTGDFQDNIENALPDQIILSETLKKIGNNINRLASTISLKALYDYDRFEIEPYSDGLYLIQGSDYLVYGQALLDSLINASTYQMEGIKKLAEENPDANVNVYKINREIDFHLKNEYDNFYVDFFEGKVKYSSFSKINSYDDYKKYFYKSDHHWNHLGQYEAYKEIADLLNFENIIEIEKTNCFNGLQFRGSKARTVGNNEIMDDFCVNEYKLPNNHITVIGNEMNLEPIRDLYREKKMPIISDISHYSNYYGPDHGEILYTFNENIGKKTLLMIVDSYSNPINDLIAANYYKTYAVDLRSYESLTGKEFNINEYIKTNNINDVLIFGNINLFIDSTFYIN